MKKLFTITLAVIAISCQKEVAPELPAITFDSLQAKKIDCKSCQVYMESNGTNEALAYTFCYNYCQAVKKLGKGRLK